MLRRGPFGPILGAVLAAGLLVAPAMAHTEPAAPSAAAHTEPAAKKPAKSCRSRLVNPRETVAAKTFAVCVTKAMQAASTVHLKTAYDDGSRSAGVLRYGRTVDASVEYNDGSALVVLGRATYYKGVDHGWVRAKATGNANEALAHTIAVLWRQASALSVYRAAMQSSTVGWVPTGAERRLNGTRAKEYAGNPTMAGMTFENYSVWLDSADRPVRITSTGTNFGVTVTMVQDFSKWGRAVKIVPPTVR